MMSCNHPLIILTCKHLKERARRPCHTIWEITSGVLVFVVLLLMRQVIRQNDYSLITHVDDQRVDYIAFTPNDEVTKNFMRNVTKKLSVSNISTNQGPPIYVQGFQNEAEIQEYVKKNNTSPIAIIRFRNVNEMSKLDYTIDLVNAHVNQRPKFMRLHIKEPLDEQQHASLPLLKLQWAIDKTFMERLSGENISHKVRFPQFLSAPQPKIPLSVIHQFLIFCTVAAPLPFFLYNSSRLVKERRTGLKELMKIVGCSPTVLRVSHLMDTALLSTIYAGFITTLLKVTSAPILPESNAFIIAFTIILHFLNITSLAFVTSSFSGAYEHANGLALVIYIVSCMFCNIWYNNYETAWGVYLVCWFLPHAPVYMFWDEVKYLESVGEGINFENIVQLHGESYVPVLLTWLVFIVQQVFIMALAWYLDMVRPGNYGVAQKWDFLFKKDFWVYRKKVTFHVTVEQTRKVMRDDRFFQKQPLNAPVAIKLTKVSKLYSHGFRQRKIVALDDVNLDIYRGEITVVLGIDGSGKTTLVSVITGMTSATKGKVYVNGFDNAVRLREIRKNLGLCPQQHLTFDYLTVRENIIFFEKLRGVKREVRTTAENLITRLYLQDKADYFSHQLSPSEERCLQVACALAGGAEVLVLDEPTSNCDSETRHNLWDVILVLRGDRTILMTTTSIEEADALGDRVALLSHGKLRCYGTPMFLKNAIGTGFNLSVTLKHKFNVALVREVIDQTLPDALTTMIDQRRVLFTLPAKDHELFPKLFDTLEERKMELGITSMGVGMSLEEMFLGFVDEEDVEEALFVKSFHAVPQLKGLCLRFQQMRVLMQRNFYNMWSVKYSFIILQIIVPVLGIIVITVTTNSHGSLDYIDQPTWGILVESPTVLVDLGPGRSGDLDQIRRLNHDLKIFRSNNISQDLLKLSQIDRRNDELSKNVIGIKMEKNFSKIYFRFQSQPEATRALNVFSNIYMSMALSSYEPITISEPGTKKVNLFIPKETILCLFWAIWVTFFITLPLTPFIAMSIRDYRAAVRPTHRIVGCPNIIHWLAKLASQMIVFLTIIPPAVLLSAKYLDREETLSEDGFLVALLVAQLLFLPAFLLQLYVLSFFLDEHHAVSQIYIQSIALGFSGPVIQILLKDLSEKSKVYASPVMFLTILGSLSPVFTLSEVIAKFTATARVRSFCSHNDHYCQYLIPTDSKSKLLDTVCCDPNRQEYDYYKGTALVEIVILACHILFYAIILVAVQKRWIQDLIERVANRKYKETPPNYDDLLVYHEKATVTRLMQCMRDPSQCHERPPKTMLLVDDLHKKNTNFFHKFRRITAVKGVSFRVHAGESLVILGEDGAGKTSTLLMIAGYLSVTRGDCFVDGVFMKKQRSKYIDKVSLTRCIGGLDEFYTGYRNMKMLCLLHGFPRKHAGAFAVNCMSYMGLQHLLHVPVRTYSAGCARRLGLCAALLAAPPAVLLDEPMRSLDPHARPLVARALASLRSSGSALVITEQSLTWRDLDALNSRVAVMSNGRIVALGQSRKIREMFAEGHTARLKLKLKPMRRQTRPILLPSMIRIVDETAENVKGKRGKAKSSAISNLMHRYKSTESVESVKTSSTKRRYYWTKKIVSEEKITDEIKDNKIYRRSRHALTTLEYRSPSDEEIEDEDGPRKKHSRLEKAIIDSVIPSSRKTKENLLEYENIDEETPQAESSEARTDQPTPDLKGSHVEEQAGSSRDEDGPREKHSRLEKAKTDSVIPSSRKTKENLEFENIDEDTPQAESSEAKTDQPTPELKGSRVEEQAGSSRDEDGPQEKHSRLEKAETDSVIPSSRKTKENLLEYENIDEDTPQAESSEAKTDQPTPELKSSRVEEQAGSSRDEEGPREKHSRLEKADSDSVIPSSKKTNENLLEFENIDEDKSQAESSEAKTDQPTPELKGSRVEEQAGSSRDEVGPREKHSRLEEEKTDSVILSSRKTKENLGFENTDEDKPQAKSSEAKTDQPTPDLKGSRVGEQAGSSRDEDGPREKHSRLEKAETDSVIPSSRKTKENLLEYENIDEDKPQAESSEARTDQPTPELKGSHVEEQAGSSRDEDGPREKHSRLEKAKTDSVISSSRKMKENLEFENIDEDKSQAESSEAKTDQPTPELKGIRVEEQAGSSRDESAQAESAPDISDDEEDDSKTRSIFQNIRHMVESELVLAGPLKDFSSPSITTMNRVHSVMDLKADFKRQFPTSELADEHLSMLYFCIKGDNPMPYSLIFSKLEWLKSVYPDIIEDYTLSEISMDEVYGLLTKEAT